jgi:hypothetical protein
VQDRPPPRRGAGDLPESEAQAETGLMKPVKKSLTAETAETAEKKTPRLLGVLCVLCGKTAHFSIFSKRLVRRPRTKD